MKIKTISKCKMKYSVIGSATHFAITDFGLHAKCKLSEAKVALGRCKSVLAETRFSNGRKARRWHWDFATEAEAIAFVSRCNSSLAYQAGRRDRWITPTFVHVAKSTLPLQKAA